MCACVVVLVCLCCIGVMLCVVIYCWCVQVVVVLLCCVVLRGVVLCCVCCFCGCSFWLASCRVPLFRLAYVRFTAVRCSCSLFWFMCNLLCWCFVVASGWCVGLCCFVWFGVCA